VKRRAAPKRRRVTRRRRTARVKRSRGGKKGLAGYRKMMMDAMNLRSVGIVTLGLALPTMSAFLGQYVPAMVKDAVARVPYIDTRVGKAALMVGSTAAVAFALQSKMLGGLISYNEAVAATGVSMALVAVSLAQSYYNGPGSAMLADLPTAGALAGYGGYYGYLGSAHDGGMYGEHSMAGEHELFGTHTMAGEHDLFGVKTNVF
tara:strand:+ start:1279 stop:1890 length:612 start_codon:yes stop_codon:yes gene_type:complete